MYDEAIKIDPKDVLAYCNKGWILILSKLLIGNSLHNLKRYDEAMQIYDEAIKIDPKFAAAYYNKGWIIKFIKIKPNHCFYLKDIKNPRIIFKSI